MKITYLFFLSACCLLSFTPGLAQPVSTPTQPVSRPEAKPADVASVDGIMAALYDVISGPAGKKRDWDRMRSLFTPGAKLMPIVKRKEGGFATIQLDVEDYIKRSGPRLEGDGFFEQEVSRRAERFGNLVHVFSTYESRLKAEDKEPFARGINSLQLTYDGQRWWIVNLAWESERPDNPLPAEYLKRK